MLSSKPSIHCHTPSRSLSFFIIAEKPIMSTELEICTLKKEGELEYFLIFFFFFQIPWELHLQVETEAINFVPEKASSFLDIVLKRSSCLELAPTTTKICFQFVSLPSNVLREVTTKSFRWIRPSNFHLKLLLDFR